MSRGVRALAALAGVVAFIVTGAAWLQSPHGITGDDAVRVAQRAFAAAGLGDAVVEPHPVPDDYDADGESSPTAVWKTVAALGEGKVELWLARSDGGSVFLDDRTDDGAAQLLTDQQFERLADYFDNPAAGRQASRNVAVTVAAALVALVAATLARDPFPTRRPSDEEPH